MCRHNILLPAYKKHHNKHNFLTTKFLPMVLNQKAFCCTFFKKGIIKNIVLFLLLTCLLPFTRLKAQSWSPVNPQANGLFNLPGSNTFHLGRVNIGGNLFPGVLPGPNSSRLQVTNGSIAQVQSGTFGSFSTGLPSNTWLGLGQNPLISAYGLGMFKTNKFGFFNLEDVTRTTATKDLIVGFGAVAGTNADQRMVFRNYTTTGASNAPLAVRDILSLNPNGSAGINDINPISTLFVNAVNSASGFRSIFLLNGGAVSNFPGATFCAIGQEGNSTGNFPIFGFRGQLGNGNTGSIATNLQVTGIPAAPVAATTQEVEITFQDLSTVNPVSSINRFNATSFDRLGVFFRNGTNNPADKRRVLAIMANGTVGVNTRAVNPVRNVTGVSALPAALRFNAPIDLDVPRGGIRTRYIYIVSDKSLKQNVATIVDPIAKINKLRGTTFTLTGETTEDNLPSYGFIAQEVQQTVPELTGMGEDSIMGVNYNGITPLLVEGVKVIAQRIGIVTARMDELASQNADLVASNSKLTAENTQLKTQVDNMNTWIAEVSARLNIAPPVGITGAVSNATNTGRPPAEVNPVAPNGSRLLQNRPNPTNGFTEIFYELKDEGTAALTITDQQGRILKTYSNLAKGQGKIVINKGDLNAGTYIYSLTINGKLISSRQMVIL
jgi:Chaperone of endosialidase